MQIPPFNLQHRGRALMAADVWLCVIWSRPRSQTDMTTWWLSEAQEAHICRLHRPAGTQAHVRAGRQNAGRWCCRIMSGNRGRSWKKRLLSAGRLSLQGSYIDWYLWPNEALWRTFPSVSEQQNHKHPSWSRWPKNCAIKSKLIQNVHKFSNAESTNCLIPLFFSPWKAPALRKQVWGFLQADTSTLRCARKARIHLVPSREGQSRRVFYAISPIARWF